MTKMRKLAQKNWLFLGYLALLFNLGPSLHHADFFGLHCTGSCCQNSFFQDEASCCCGHDHSHGSHHHEHSSDSSGDSSGDSSDCFEDGISAANHGCDSSCEDCAFCKFFDQFNVVSENFEFVLTQSPVCSLIASSQGTAFCECVPESARGPPEFFSAELAV